ncbi:hypothetical protein IV102_13315 [bacterium]|nr:hypothetical protein [bacterium]
MPTNSTEKGYTLAEVLLAIFFAIVIFLTLVGLGLTTLAGGQKTSDLSLAQSAAHELLESAIYEASDLPGSAFWLSTSDSNPYSLSQVASGRQAYTVALYLSDATDPGTPTLKRCRIRLSWWGGESDRAGYGQLHTEAVRYVSKP